MVERSGGNPLFAEEMARRISEEGSIEAAELPDTVQARAGGAPRLARAVRAPAGAAGGRGRAHVLGGRARPLATRRVASLGQRSSRSRRRTSSSPAPRAAGRRAGAAFKHVLIRDVAYGMLPKAVRARKHFEVGAFMEDRAGDRSDESVALLAEHYGRAAALGREGGVPPQELEKMQRRALHFLEEAGDAAAHLYANREAAAHYRHARAICPQDGRADVVRIGEKLGDVSLRLGRVDEAIAVWLECLDWHRGQEDLERVADLHRKIGAALSHKGERKTAIEHYQKGINLLKDGPPRHRARAAL